MYWRTRGYTKRFTWAALVCLLASSAGILLPTAALASDETLVTWDDLVPGGLSQPQAVSEPSPATGSLSTLGGASDRFDPLQPGSDPNETWQAQSFDVTPSFLGKDVMIDGYVLPLTWDTGRVVEFLLVPWIGACIHTPAPPPNQIIHVSYPEGLPLTKPYEPVRLAGELQHQPATHLLFLVDGSRPIQTSFSLAGADVSGSPVEIVAASASEVPVLARAQIWANTLFTDSMTSLGNGGSTGALLFALLLSFGYGALHTFGPGHGKSVVVSYFIGTGGSLQRGLTMGVRIAVFHVLSAIVLVFLFDFAVRQTTGSSPSSYHAIRLASYGLIIAIGAVMLWQAVTAIHRHRAEVARGVSQVGHHDHPAHSHDGHFQSDGHLHSGCAACAAAAEPKGSGWIAASVGLVPCTGALIVMLFGLANDLVWPAILMVTAISAGMAMAMSAIGVVALWGRNWAGRRLDKDSRRRVHFELSARLAGATCVFVIGAILFGLTLTLEPLPGMPASALAMQESTQREVGG